MAVVRLDNIRPEMLRWAYERAGFNEESAKEAFPKLADWLSGVKLPTMAQLQKFASKFHTPIGYLFLNEVPEENIPIPMFRGSANITGHFDLDVYDTVLNVQSRQDWLEDYLSENDIETCKIVGVVTAETPISESVNILRQALQLDPRWAFSLASADVAVSMLTERLEQNGVFVAYNGVVGNNTHRPLKVTECRGFALVNNVAPYIFVNSADSKTAQLFTLIHETAHIMMGVSAGHADGDGETHGNTSENYCDKVAAEFLVPATVLREVWNGDIKWVSRRFKVSELVIARRTRDLSLITNDEYRVFWAEYSRRPIIKRTSAGGSFYLSSVKRVGRTFAIHVRNAVQSRQLSYTEAYRLTGLSGRAYEQFMVKYV